MTFNIGDFVTLEKGETGQIWAVSGEIVMVCSPDNNARKVVMYTKHQLYQWEPDEKLSTG